VARQFSPSLWLTVRGDSLSRRRLASPVSAGGCFSALNGELADLAQWTDVEPQLVERIEKLLLGVATGDEDEKEFRKRPLTRAALLAACQTLINERGLPKEWVEPPDFAIRSYAYFKDPNPPELLLLNSFFFTDLALARKLFAEGKAPQNLRRYLGVERPQNSPDLLRDTAALAEAVSPGFTPLSRWPGKGRHPLVLLQQAAVNLVFRETKAGGLLGVNGPPGTGKTTLLRDLVAGVVTDRAEAMAKFDDPETAFEHSGQKLKAGEGWIHLYRLNASLRGFDMVIASSNNKAVENVSAELPGLNAIANDAPELRYFKTLSDALHQCKTWGTIAAVLGNAQNRGRFKQASVQTLADAASAYASEFQTKVGSRSVGVPLLVHRRCSEPMFGVSNAIAYSIPE
jgi:energy-coupling factor transporter ATP-binding protein EcfA2